MDPARETLQQLERARAALEAGAGVTALRALIDAWRSYRTAELYELIERLSPRVAQDRELPPAKTQIEGLANWIARSRERNPADLHVLLEAFDRIVERRHRRPIRTALAELAEWGDDPRVSSKLVQHFGQWGREQRQRVGQILVACADPRALPTVIRLEQRGLVEQFELRLAELGSAANPVADPAIDAVCEQLRQLVDAAHLDPAADKLAREHGPKTREQLLDEVYAAPADDAARLVLGDWLQSRGDPLGELITLQFHRREQAPTSEATARERELISLHSETWLGPLARLVYPGSARFERGFPVQVSVKPVNIGLVGLEQGHREWATLEHVSFTHQMRGSGSIISPHMRAIRELDHVCDQGLLALATKFDSLSVEYVSYKINGNSGIERVLEGKGVRALRECHGLDNLRSLCIESLLATPDRMEWLWDSKIGRQLNSFAVTDEFTPLASWSHVPPNVQRVALIDGPRWWMIERDQAGHWTRLHIYLAYAVEQQTLIRALSGLNDDQLTDIRVEIQTTQYQLEERVGQIEPVLSRFAGARLEIGMKTGERPPWRPR